jgi:hypothetical protein
MNDPSITTSTTIDLSISIPHTVITASRDGSHVHTHVAAVRGAVGEEREDPIGEGVRWMEGGSSEVKAAIH